MEQNVPVMLDARCRELVSFVNRVGPANVRCLIDIGGFNYTTYKPHWSELLNLGVFKIDEKRRFRLTPKAGPCLVEGWAEKTVLERWESTHSDNLADLGVFDEVRRALERDYPRKHPAAETLVPLSLDSQPVRDALECIRKLNPKDSEQRVRGLTMLSWIVLSQHPEILREAIAQRETMFLREFNQKPSWDGRSFRERVSDWFWLRSPF